MTNTITDSDAVELFRSDPHQFLPVSTGEVAYRRIGSGPDVLFVHGWPLSGATFRGLLPAMAEHVTCHVIDMPGAGSSRYSADTNFTLATHVEALRSVVDQLGFESVGLVGHDSGGLLARHAMAGDSRLRALGLIGTEQPQAIGWRLRLLLATMKLPTAARVLGLLAGTPFLRCNNLAFGKVLADKDLLDGEFDEFFLTPLSNDRALQKASTTLARNFDFGFVRDLEDKHRQIDAPTVLVWGAEDAYFPIPLAQEMVEQFDEAANARLEVIEGAGLLAHEERPDEVAEALLSVVT